MPVPGDARTMDAQVAGTDPESDVAAVRIQADGLTPVALRHPDVPSAKVAPGTEAALQGWRERYVIQEVNRRPIHHEQQFQEAVSPAPREGRRLRLLITHVRVSLYVALNPSQESLNPKQES